ncbi:MAG TPA: CotH kinase family protein [bacterium]|nr:CotH kinase family protein [bacterium]HQI48438.1 CotH kinase family protein [bacterium]HQJ65900.1 CotH kinase family protein [bacterium]
MFSMRKESSPSIRRGACRVIRRLIATGGGSAWVWVTGLALLTFSSLSAQTTGVAFTSSNLPIIRIDTGGKEIPDLTRIRATMKITYNGKSKRNAITDPANQYDGLIDIELRGSSSMAYPKKGYRLETVDASGNNRNVSLLGMPKENDWILYASYDDQSLMRNVLAYRISNEIGRYAPRVQYCELVLNNNYRGVYVFMEKIKQDKNRVAITEMSTADVTGDALTGGYIWKFDKEEGEQTAGWTSMQGLFYQYHDPKADDLVAAQKGYLKGWMNVFESVMLMPTRGDTSFGYPRYIDISSFVDHFILSEFFKNVDAYRISTFMYKDRDSKGGKLNAGPIWDFNLTLGKAWYAEDAGRVDEWEIDHDAYHPGDWPKVPFWWNLLGHDRYFAEKVKIRWAALSRTVLHPDTLDRRIDLIADTLAEARARDLKRWPEPSMDHSYAEELSRIKSWIRGRTLWINNHLWNLAAVDGAEAVEKGLEFVLCQNYPNPFNQGTSIRYCLPGRGRVWLRLFNLAGQEVATLAEGLQPAGEYRVALDGAGMASGVYFYRLEWERRVETRRLILLR